jgi:hypothetical protein
MRRFFVAAGAVAMLALAAAGVGSAGRETMTLMCGGQPVTITATSTTSDPSVAWGTGQIDAGEHLIPISFSGTFTDVTQGVQLESFFQAKGHGNGMHNQPTISCTQSLTTTAGDVGAPGLPATDVIESDFTVTAVVKP